MDDVLCVSHNAESILKNEINKYFVLKKESIGPPKQYLGGKLRLVDLENGNTAWAFSSTQYVQAAVENVENYLKSKGKVLPRKTPNPLANNYRPEMGVERWRMV